jgi:integrase
MILCRDADGKSLSVHNEALDALNLRWKNGDITKELADEKVKEIKHQLRVVRDKVSVFNSANAKILAEYWEREYTHRILIDPASMKNSLIAAINSVGNLSLLVATRAELQTRINELFIDDPEKHRRVCSRLNQILRYLGRGFKLQLAKADNPEVAYISESQLSLLMSALPFHLHRFVGTLFYTGMRLGEMFKFEIKSSGVISVKKQLDKKGKERAVKNRRPRTVAVDEAGWEYVHQFYEMREWPSGDDGLLYPRNYDYRRVIKKAAKKVFKNPRNHITVHDLRHSFAIHMLNKGLSITEIALLLGDSVTVANRYYLGFVATDETITMIQKKLAMK